MNSKLNLISGTRPTGSLHLGHYLGVLRNWVELQNTEKYNCFFFIADWHSLTTKYSDTNEIQKNTIEVAKDFLASGLDPTKSTIYVQSAIPEIAELHLLLSMITPNNWVERDPTLKDLVRAFNGNKIKEETEIENNTNNQLTYGMLGYPILQTSDILSFQGSLVPVGKDQVAHLEMSRDIARKFNSLYQVELFPEPKPLLTKTPVVLGVDGDKMSKSYNNDIKLAASEEETFKMVKQMVTDAERIKKTDPGNTERCLVPYPYYKIFADTETQKLVKEECEGAQIGCFDCKKRLSGLINDYFADIRTKRKGLNDEEVISILKEGNARAKEKASKVLDQA
ncbi:MAG TPA: tryptophan--tRNA ligase, partial [Vampirovibrionales bacterium]